MALRETTHDGAWEADPLTHLNPEEDAVTPAEMDRVDARRRWLLHSALVEVLRIEPPVSRLQNRAPAVLVPSADAAVHVEAWIVDCGKRTRSVPVDFYRDNWYSSETVNLLFRRPPTESGERTARRRRSRQQKTWKAKSTHLQSDSAWVANLERIA